MMKIYIQSIEFQVMYRAPISKYLGVAKIGTLIFDFPLSGAMISFTEK